MNLTLTDYIAKIQNKECQPYELNQQYYQRVLENNPVLKAFVRTYEPQDVEMSGPLCGAPLALKDNMMLAGKPATACSHILEDYVAPYTATCVNRLLKAGAYVLGHSNMDEFAMGTTSEHSCHEPPCNPHDHTRIAGGSSGGSAVAVASDMCLAAFGTDTGGSIRLPAAMCGVVGLKPSYGRVSRYGIMSMASSFDQVGTFTKTVEDAATLLDIISGHDKNDATSIERDDHQSWKKSLHKDIKDLKIALPKQFFAEGLDQRIKEKTLAIIKQLEQQGAHVEYVDMPLLEYGLAAYYTLVPAEVSTNMARYDGIRFGKQADTNGYASFHDYMSDMRTQGFGAEVTRRILIGGFVLSSAHYEGYFLKAQKLRMKLKKSFDEVFKKYDLIVSPTSPEPAWKLGSKTDDPLKLYLADIYTVSVNLCGLPGISVPIGTVEEEGSHLPIGIQLIADQWREGLLFQLGSIIEKI